MAIEVNTVADRDIDGSGFMTNRMVLARKSYFPYWDGTGDAPSNTGTVDVIGGVTSMSWYVYNCEDGSMINKSLLTFGREVLDSEVKDELVAAGWILPADEVIIT